MLSLSPQVLRAGVFDGSLHRGIGISGLFLFGRVMRWDRGWRRRDRVRVGLNIRGEKSCEFGEVFAEHVGRALRFGNAQADARPRKASLGAFEFTVDAFFDALGNRFL